MTNEEMLDKLCRELFEIRYIIAGIQTTKAKAEREALRREMEAYKEGLYDLKKNLLYRINEGDRNNGDNGSTTHE